MKNLKALIHIERTPAIWMGIYFLIINVIASIILAAQIGMQWQRYLAKGINAFSLWIFDDFVYGITLTLLIGYGLGILMLVYLQFKKDKSIEISRFMKALPYTNGQRCLVKMGLGILSFTTMFGLYVIIFLCIRSYGMHLFGEIYRTTAFEELATYLNRPMGYLSFMGIIYVRMLVIYLILVMCEYLMSHNVGSLIVAILSSVAPLYVWLSQSTMKPYTERNNLINEWSYKIYMDYSTYGKINIIGNQRWNHVNYRVTESAGVIFMIYLGIIVICSLVIANKVKSQRVENADIFIPGTITRYIFIGGVAVCSGFVVRDIGRLIITTVLVGCSDTLLYILLGIGLVIGGLVASKIANIGRIEKKAV